MKKKLILGTILVLSLAITVAVAAVAPSLAGFASPANSDVKFYGTGAKVVVQLPQGGAALASRPATLQFQVSDLDKRSDYGGTDVLFVYLWVPALNGFIPVADISDNPDPAAIALIKGVWNNSFVWLPPLFPNVFQLADKELEVWTEKASSQSGNGGWSWDEYGRYVWDIPGDDALIVNLTKTVHISLPFNLLIGTPFAAAGNQTFDLPPMTLTFRGSDEGSPVESTYNFPPRPIGSGWTIKNTGTGKPAWATVDIPAWLGTVLRTPLDVTGSVLLNMHSTYTPPP